jgi:DNA-binding response OmpR family regulator
MDHRKILVVDSDKGAARYVRKYLEESGYRVFEAYDGETALQMIHHEKPDLAILELTLPDRDGLDVIATIRDDPRLSRLPIIVLSTRATESDKLFGLESGADDYLAKPFNPRELLARVYAVLRRSHRQNARTKALPSSEKEMEIRVTQ